jgi:ATP/maltotriose-dependent transcriptional regulator MalT
MRVPRMKTLVPELPSQFVSRPRLLEVLDDGPTGVTLVSAPPGYGKNPGAVMTSRTSVPRRGCVS